MAVELYLYDTRKRMRRTIVWGVSKLIHDERDFLLTSEILSDYGAMPGEFLGFECVDGRFRLFEIEEAVVDLAGGYTAITATEAAVSELAHSIVEEVRLESTGAVSAAQAALAGSGFTLGRTSEGRSGEISKYFETRWKVLREIESVCNVRVTPYYTVTDGVITGKIVDIEARTYRRTGRILQRETDATNVKITYSGVPIARMYGVGKSTGTEDPPSRVTFADVVWSKAAGDPLDKPAGQAYLEDPDVIAEHGGGREEVFEDRNIEDGNELIRATYEEFERKKRPQVSGAATAFDVEHIPGYEHKAVRMYDILDVPTDDGGTVEGKVIGIRRNYLRPEMTQITLGEEKESAKRSIAKQVAALTNETTRLRGSAGSAAGRSAANKKLIELNAEQINLTASNLEEYQAGTDELLTEAYLTLYGDGTSANAGLVARVEDHDGEISRAALTLYGDGTSAQAGLVAKVDENAASITATANELQSELELKADLIVLDGYVTASQLQTEFSNFESGISDNLYVSALSANGFECSSFDFKGYGMSLDSMTVVTGVKNYGGYNVMLGDGSTKLIYAFSSSGNSGMVNRDTIYYMSWE